MRYAKSTVVSPEKSRMEIESTVRKYKADQFGVATDNEARRAMVQFRMNKWIVRFELPLDVKSEQQLRQRWRALLLSVKAKLEVVESGISTFEEEFLSHIVMPNGQAFGKFAVPQIEQAREAGKMPTNLLEWKG